MEKLIDFIIELVKHAGITGIAKAVSMAVASQDYSLVESLVWRLRGGLEKYPDLLNLAIDIQKNSPQITKAMNARI